MKNMWKWAIGIVIVMVLAVALLAAPIAFHSARIANYQGFTTPMRPGFNKGHLMDGNNEWQHPPIPGGMNGYQSRPGIMPGLDRGFRQDYHRFDQPSRFGAGLMILGGLARMIPLVFLGALIFGAYQLGKRSGRRENLAPTAVQPATTTPAPEPAAEEKPAEQADNN